MKIFTAILMAVIIAVLSYFVVFNGVRNVLRQHDAELYPHVRGTIISSTVTVTHGSKGHTYYHAHISYRYTVDGVDYTGYRYRYDGHPTDSTSVYAVVNSHPSGSAVDVYYNPANPADVLLSPGVDVADVAFNFFMASMILFLLLSLLKGMRQADLPWSARKSAGGVKVITDMLVTRLRLPRFSPLSFTLVATCILMLLAAAIIAFGLLSIPPWVAGQWALVIVIIGSVVVYAWQYLDVHSGRRDLVIDEGARTVKLPLTYGRREQTPVSFLQIRSIQLKKVKHQRKGGAYYTYMVTLEMADASQQKLINLSQARAESLGAWLKDKLGVSQQAIEPAKNQPL